MSDKLKLIIAIIVGLGILFGISSCISSCGCGDDDDGGKCRYCGKQTTYKYRTGGWICYSCDKKYSYSITFPEIDNLEESLITA
jgi:ribosomal protein L37AE/L43A